MDTMLDVARAALDQMPPESRLRESDTHVIARYRDALLALEGEAVKRFYDTLYGHPTTAAVFVNGERPAREQTLVGWWRRTLTGPLDENYFAWMAEVGLVHVHRRVSNAMMVSMAGFVCAFVTEKVATLNLNRSEADALIEAFARLTSTVSAVIGFGYDRATNRAVKTALDDLAGMPESLFDRLHSQEVAAALARAKANTFNDPRYTM
jgi:hypothetical protein